MVGKGTEVLPPFFSDGQWRRARENINVMTESRTEQEPRKGDAPALAAFILGVGAVGSAIADVPRQLFSIVGLIAVIVGAYAVARTGKAPANRLARLTGISGLLLGGFTAVTPLFQAPTITTCGKSGDLMIATALESAILNFRTEYDTLPDVGRNIVTTDSPDGVRLLRILLGLEHQTDVPQNRRNIKFLSVREGKNRHHGLIYTEDCTTVEGLFDEFGNGYTIVLQAKPGEPLLVPFGKRTIDLKGRNCAVFSPGKDGKPGTIDDVTTW